MSTTLSNPASFHAAAAAQRVCQRCGLPGKPYEAHHLIKKQRLRNKGLPLNDPRGAIRLCEGLDTDRCHHKVEKQGDHLPTDKLTQVQICYLWECLGPAGHNTLDREYTGADRRFTLHEEERCPACQRQ